MTMTGQQIIADQIIEVMNECKTISKSGTNKHQGYEYSAEEDYLPVTNAMIKHGLVFSIHKIDVVECTIRSSGKDRSANYMAAIITYELASTKTEATKHIPVLMTAQDSQDKAAPKLLTMALKYLYNQTFQLKRGIDPDADVLDVFRLWADDNIDGGYQSVVSYAKSRRFGNPSDWSQQNKFRLMQKIMAGDHELVIGPTGN
mgnify:CR=1 FL=1|tara:strand:- start:24430 stop:25035 length:606 start_codon:yes stop_codon:yes gene_type:complete